MASDMYAPTPDDVRNDYATFSNRAEFSLLQAEAFDRMIANVKAEERERCAKIAETLPLTIDHIGYEAVEIAAAIREGVSL